MPLTSLDPVTALVTIDLQQGILGLPTAHPVGPILANAAALADAFRRRGLPVALVNVAGRSPGRTQARPTASPSSPNWTELAPELGRAPDDILVTKYTWGAFHGTPLDLHLRRRGATQLVLCGVSTSVGDESTARAAFEHGYNVTLAIDAMTDTSLESHRSSVERIFPRLGETATTTEILSRLGS